MHTSMALVKLLRPLNLLLGALAVLITAALMPRWPSWSLIGLTMVVVALYNAAANALNDWFDYPADRVNHPRRPLASGALPRWCGWVLAVALFALGSLAAAQLPTAAFRIAVYLALPLMVLYTPMFKGLPLAGNLVVAAVLGLTFLFAGAAFGQLSLMWPPAGLAFGFNLVREVVKDVEDMEGDRAQGVATFPVRYGAGAGVKLSLLLTILLMMGCLVPYITAVYGRYYLFTVVIGVELPLLYVVFYLVNNQTPAGCKWVAKVLKADIFAGLLAVYLSKFDF